MPSNRPDGMREIMCHITYLGTYLGTGVEGRCDAAFCHKSSVSAEGVIVGSAMTPGGHLNVHKTLV